MAVSETITPEARETVTGIGQAAFVLALPSCHTRESLAVAIAEFGPILTSLVPNQKTVLLYPDTAGSPTNEAGESAWLAPGSLLHLLPYPLPHAEGLGDPVVDRGLRSVLQVGQTLGARGCALLGSDSAVTTPEDLRALAEPVLSSEADLAVSQYARSKFASLVNSGIVYPLTRALYGVRVHNPMAVDLAWSARLADRELTVGRAMDSQLGWITTRAVRGGLPVCQVVRNSPAPPLAPESSELSASLALLLGKMFQELETTAGFWQKVRGSQPVRLFGHPRPMDSESSGVDVNPMVETFRRGCRDLLDIWAAVLSPATLVDLRRIAKLPVEQFRLADETWVHVLYDFILGYRQRVISREHLLRALTPIYLGWVSSYALEVQDAPPAAVEDRLERLCMSFEKLKPYLLSRWRWPDRFNP